MRVILGDAYSPEGSGRFHVPCTIDEPWRNRRFPDFFTIVRDFEDKAWHLDCSREELADKLDQVRGIPESALYSALERALKEERSLPFIRPHAPHRPVWTFSRNLHTPSFNQGQA